MKALFALGAGERGGAERALLALVRHLPQHGIEPTVAAMATGPFIDELSEAGVPVIHLPPIPRLRNAWAMPSAIAQLADAARAGGADVLVGSGEKMATLAVPAARRVGTRSAAWLHDAPDHTVTSRGIQAWLRVLAPDVVIASSGWMASEFASRLRREVLCVPCGLELDEFVDVAAAEDANVGWKDRTVFAFVGRLQQWKGADVYLRAAAEVGRRRADVGFLVVGGPLFGREQRYADSLPGLARELGLGDAVRFLGHRSDAVAVMAASDVIVHASRQPEPLGIVVLEAMALGKPVIASRTRGPEELIDDGNTGLLTAPDDVDALAAAMEGLVAAGATERTRLGDAARSAFNSGWSAPAMASRFADALRSIPSSLDVGLTAQTVTRGDGQGRFVLELGRTLASRGDRVTVYAHACDPELRELVRFRPIRRTPGPQILDDVTFLWRATPRVRRARHDVVAALGPTALPGRPFILAAQYSHRGWRRTWGPAQRPEVRHRINARAAMALEALVARHASRVVALSQEISDDLAPGHSADTVIVANGVDVDEFAPATPSERAQARRSFRVGDNARVVGFVGEYKTTRKGLGPLLAAISDGPPDEHLLIAGRGPDITGLLASLGISDRVTALGFVDPRQLYHACDAVVVPSWYEPFSLVALEAAASALPVVVTRAVGAGAFLGGGGIVIDGPDSDAIRRALDWLWADPARRHEMGAVARQVAQHLRWEQVSGPAADAVESLGRANRERRAARP